MHLGQTSFRKTGVTGNTFDVIAAPWAAYQAKYGTPVIGQRVGVSVVDSAVLWLMYGSCLTKTATSGGECCVVML